MVARSLLSSPDDKGGEVKGRTGNKSPTTNPNLKQPALSNFFFDSFTASEETV